MPEPELTISSEELLAHRTWVRDLARRLLGNSPDADDAEQETLLSALRSPPPRSAGVRAWLGTVLRHSVQRTHRTNSRRQRREMRAARSDALDLTPAEVVARAESHRRVVSAVLALDEPYRTAILLRFYQDLPAREIATRTGVPVETARTRLKRGRARLRASLSRPGLVGTLAPLVGRRHEPGLMEGTVPMTTTTKILLPLGILLVGGLAAVLVMPGVSDPEPVEKTPARPVPPTDRLREPPPADTTLVAGTRVEPATPLATKPAETSIGPAETAGAEPPTKKAEPTPRRSPRGRIRDRITFDFTSTPLSSVLEFIAQVKDLEITLDPEAVRRGAGRIAVTLKAEDLEVSRVLALLAAICDFTWIEESEGRIRIL